MTRLQHQTSTPVIALFVRIPLPGRVKTRLAAHLGDDAACALYRAMVTDILRNISACHLPIYLFHDGSDAQALPEEWARAGTRIVAQRGGDIGERMAAAFVECFAAEIDEVILIGSDIPGLDSGIINAAAHALQQHDAVIAPAVDGGYGLIALQRQSYQSALFQGIPWSSDQVLLLTVEKCNEYALRTALLSELQDIDTLEDLRSYCRQTSASAIATNRFLAEAGYLSPGQKQQQG